jgi:D-alanyl-D-alanine carboxypeptidase
VSTPAEVGTFFRAYVSGRLTGLAADDPAQQYQAGTSEPPGPGVNAAGLGVFRYQTQCGTVYGHTGNTLGYTQFAAATPDGARSVVVSVNAQITPTTNAPAFTVLHRAETQAVCELLSN